VHVPPLSLSLAITPTRGAGWLKAYVKERKIGSTVLTLDLLMQIYLQSFLTFGITLRLECLAVLPMVVIGQGAW
jgi:hypothetical protein